MSRLSASCSRARPGRCTRGVRKEQDARHRSPPRSAQGTRLPRIARDLSGGPPKLLLPLFPTPGKKPHATSFSHCQEPWGRRRCTWRPSTTIWKQPRC